MGKIVIKLNQIKLNLFLEEGSKSIFDNANAQFELGRRYRLEGANGAGKTTLFRLIDGSITKQSGVLQVEGKVFNPDMYSQPTDLTVEQYYNFLIKSSEKPSTTIDMVTFNLDHCLKTKIKDLSLGERQKVTLFPLFFAQFDIILLDESFKYIDTDSRKTIADLIDKNNPLSVIIAVEHGVDDLFDFTDVAVIENGKIIAKTLSDNERVSPHPLQEETPKPKKDHSLQFFLLSRMTTYIALVILLLGVFLTPSILSQVYNTRKPSTQEDIVTLKTREPISEELKEELKDYTNYDFSLETLRNSGSYALGINSSSYALRIDDSLTYDECRVISTYSWSHLGFLFEDKNEDNKLLLSLSYALFWCNKYPDSPKQLEDYLTVKNYKKDDKLWTSGHRTYIYLSEDRYENVMIARQFLEVLRLNATDYNQFYFKSDLGNEVIFSMTTDHENEPRKEQITWLNLKNNNKIIIEPKYEVHSYKRSYRVTSLSYDLAREFIKDPNILTLRYNGEKQLNQIKRIAKEKGAAIYLFDEKDEKSGGLNMTLIGVLVTSISYMLFFGLESKWHRLKNRKYEFFYKKDVMWRELCFQSIFCLTIFCGLAVSLFTRYWLFALLLSIELVLALVYSVSIDLYRRKNYGKSKN